MKPPFGGDQPAGKVAIIWVDKMHLFYKRSTRSRPQ